jgi:hypothetical protein
MRMLLRAGVILFGAAVATSLQAQTCLGTASFAVAPLRIGGSVGTATGVSTYGLSAAVGKRVGAFGSAGVERAEFSDVDASATILNLSAGYAIAPGPSSTVQFCPRVLFTLQSGPNVDDGFVSFSNSARVLGLGGAIGDDLVVTPTLDFVPSFAASFETAHSDVTFADDREHETINYGELDFAVGFVLNRKLTIQPAVLVPFAAEGATSTFQLLVAYSLGRRQTHP